MIIAGKALSFLSLYVRPALVRIVLWTPAAEELVLGTAIHESCGFKYRRQLNGGPALGYFQMEPNTHNDIWKNFLAYRKQLAKNIISLLSSPNADRLTELQTNDKYGAAMARVQYARASAPLPPEGNLNDQALYWKRYYNTPLGAGTPTQYINDWNSEMIAK